MFTYWLYHRAICSYFQNRYISQKLRVDVLKYDINLSGSRIACYTVIEIRMYTMIVTHSMHYNFITYALKPGDIIQYEKVRVQRA